MDVPHYYDIPYEGELKRPTVVAETTERREAEGYAKAYGCDIFKDVDGKTYRIICEEHRMVSDATVRTTR